MKHATAAALDALESVLEALRRHTELKEKSRGVFYRRAKAFLHFHEDPTELYADVRNAEGDFDRWKVDEVAEREALLAMVAQRLTERP